MLIFCKKMLTSAKLRGSWYQKVYFLKLYMRAYLRTTFQISSVILTGFRQGVILPPPPPPTSPQNEPLKRVKTEIVDSVKLWCASTGQLCFSTYSCIAFI